MKLFSSSLSIRIIFIGLPIIISLSCKKNYNESPATAPAVTTAPLTNITHSSVTTGGIILTNGNAEILQSGVVWSKSNATPTLTDSVIAGTTSSGSFTNYLTGLDFNTVYYIRAYASNTVGTGYGDIVKLNTANDTSKVRFAYNGKDVVYGIIISSVTGKKWLDRNIGASQVATSYDDYKAYGDLFQWGRPADGHQLISWTASNIGSPVNGTTTVVATSDTPGHGNFIIPPDEVPFDWRSDNNNNRWTTNSQGPCPAGWHVPSKAEWLAEVSKSSGGTAHAGGIMDIKTGYNQLKLTVAGLRYVNGPGGVNFYQVGNSGHYWSTSNQFNYDGYTDVGVIEVGPNYFQQWADAKSSGLCVRCLMN